MGNKKKRRGKSRLKRRSSSVNPTDRLTLEFTELRNAERLLRQYGEELRYVAAWQMWHFWTGQFWKLDEDGSAQRAAKETVRLMAAEAKALNKDAQVTHDEEFEQDVADKKAAKDRKKPSASPKAMKLLKHSTSYVKWCERSQNNQGLRAMLEIASSDDEVAITHDKLDKNHWLFNVENGTVNLRTGEKQPHSRPDLITKIAPITYDPEAKCPLWDKFITKAMGGDQELISYLRRFVGYSLTGETREHALVFFWGEGNNGKSTFLNTLYKMFGDYAMKASRGLLFRSRHEKHPTSLASLHGKRFVIGAEIEDDQEFDEALTKDLTGGDPINARRMREDEWEFNPTHKLFLAGNHKPRIRGVDKGIWRRMNLVPWNVTVRDKDVDKHLGEKLKGEFAGIFNWCLRGCLEWQERGLDPPEAVIAATKEYRSEQDVLGQFFEERLVIEMEGRISRVDLRKTYVDWCEELGHMPVGARKLAQALRDRHVADGYVWDATRGQSVDGWAGVRLATRKDRAERELRRNSDRLTKKEKKRLRRLAEGTNGAKVKPANDDLEDLRNTLISMQTTDKTTKSRHQSPDVPRKSR